MSMLNVTFTSVECNGRFDQRHICLVTPVIEFLRGGEQLECRLTVRDNFSQSWLLARNPKPHHNR
ncbi:MAG: hypothetical protein JW384_00067 [Nitrosomonadaceae bacterium]|nr:hypothetical protein [Nitrosomonadaceae bacterium]